MLWQRCRNVVVNVVTTLCHVGNKSCADVSFLRCGNVPVRLDFVKTLPQRYYNVAIALSIGFLGHFITDYSDFFPVIEMWESYESAKWH